MQLADDPPIPRSSLILREGIEQYQCFDYIGAPWRLDDLWCVGKPWLTQVGGNGGFSLRSREASLRCIDRYGYVRGQCEDVYFAEAMPLVQVIPPFSNLSAAPSPRFPP